MVDLFNPDPALVRSNITRVRNEIAAACKRVGRQPESVQICMAAKYIEASALPQLVDAGVDAFGENRLQQLVEHQELLAGHQATPQWHFIGALQSRKIAQIAGRVAAIHSVSSDTVVAQLNQLPGPWPKLFVQVNVSGEPQKQGVMPDRLDQFLDSINLPVAGLMTMPPETDDPTASRPYFQELARLATQNGLSELSIGTSQDFIIAVEEGATVVRLGSILLR